MRIWFLLLSCISFVFSIEGSPYQAALQEYKPSIPEKEVRALWITRASLQTAKSIRAVIESMRRNNLNTAMVQVRGRGESYYVSDFVPRARGLEGGLDPLAEFMKVAKPYGISVHAWVNVFLAADRETIRTAPREHLIYTHRDWFLRDRTGRSMLEYSGAELIRADIEGGFLDPSNEAVRQYNVRVVGEILSRYAVNGIHLDYIRYPSSQAGTVYDFGMPLSNPRTQKDFVYEMQTTRKSRRDYITQMVAEIRSEVRRKNPDVILSAAVWPNKQKIEERVFQMWPEWLSRGLIDYAFLMSYYDTVQRFDERITPFFDPRINSRMILGVGLYRNPSPTVTLHQLKTSRAIGSAGICYFQANWFLSKDASEKEKRHQMPVMFGSWREAGLAPK
ncbi:MAG: family 10 glycosylhydrolase [Spirochaetia bacterium]|nr:family 10 glycosylhydrolase [Spirochaetia bacterium]